MKNECDNLARLNASAALTVLGALIKMPPSLFLCILALSSYEEAISAHATVNWLA
jgi:hypothetical protein